MAGNHSLSCYLECDAAGATGIEPDVRRVQKLSHIMKMVLGTGNTTQPNTDQTIIAEFTNRDTYDRRCPALLLSLLSANSPITFESILSSLPTRTIVSLSKVCKGLRHVQRTYWNIDAHLRRWVSNPTYFRNLMAATGAICGGSDALQFLLKEEWDCDLNIFVEKKEDAYQWWEYLESENYVFDVQVDPDTGVATQPRWSQIEEIYYGMMDRLCTQENFRKDFNRWEVLYDMKHMLGFQGFSHPTSAKRIKLIIAKSNALYSILRSFPVTPAHTFYTASKVYSLFPHPTFTKRVQYPTRITSSSKYICKYGAHGFKTALEAAELDPRYSTSRADFERQSPKWPLRHHRRVADGCSWVFPFDADSADDPVVDMATFNIFSSNAYYNSRESDSETGEWAPTVFCTVLSSPGLEREYIVDGAEQEDNYGYYGTGLWASFLRRKLEGFRKVQSFVDPYGEGYKYDSQLCELYEDWCKSSEGVEGRKSLE